MSGSTQEAEALAGVDQQVAAKGFEIADQLYQQGVSESQMSSSIFNQLMNAQTAQNAQLTGAIGAFAKSLAGG
jgi:hemoglobin-like flavoprotein